MKMVDSHIKKEIYKKVSLVVDDYISHQIEIKRLKQYFRNGSNLTTLISDIGKIGIDSFGSQQEYKAYIKVTLYRILSDRDAFERDQRSQSKVVKTFNEFKKYNFDDEN